jgi:hypothetical protein
MIWLDLAKEDWQKVGLDLETSRGRVEYHCLVFRADAESLSP